MAELIKFIKDYLNMNENNFAGRKDYSKEVMNKLWIFVYQNCQKKEKEYLEKNNLWLLTKYI